MNIKQGREVIQVISIGVLPYQERKLGELAEEYQKSKSELVREALHLLFVSYKEEKECQKTESTG